MTYWYLDYLTDTRTVQRDPTNVLNDAVQTGHHLCQCPYQTLKKNKYESKSARTVRITYGRAYYFYFPFAPCLVEAFLCLGRNIRMINSGFNPPSTECSKLFGHRFCVLEIYEWDTALKRQISPSWSSNRWCRFRWDDCQGYTSSYCRTDPWCCPVLEVCDNEDSCDTAESWKGLCRMVGRL